MKIRDQKKLQIAGNTIYFPFDPYKQQEGFMSKMIDCLQGRGNALLESPTGTGKTLSVISSVIGWLENQHKNNTCKSTKVFVSSRTHTQIKQLVKELRKTAYKLNMTILGSRDQLCINEHLQGLSSGEKTSRCHMLTQSRGSFGCKYNNTYKKFTDADKDAKFSYEEFDIEDLVSDAKSHKYCPYFLARDMMNKANVVFLPYQYLLSPDFRNVIQDYLKDAIVIFDEAHNVESTAEHEFSQVESLESLERVKKEIDQLTALKAKNTGDYENKLMREARQLVDKFYKELVGKGISDKFYTERLKFSDIFKMFAGFMGSNGADLRTLMSNGVKKVSEDKVHEGMMLIKDHNSSLEIELENLQQEINKKMAGGEPIESKLHLNHPSNKFTIS